MTDYRSGREVHFCLQARALYISHDGEDHNVGTYGLNILGFPFYFFLELNKIKITVKNSYRWKTQIKILDLYLNSCLFASCLYVWDFSSFPFIVYGFFIDLDRDRDQRPFFDFLLATQAFYHFYPLFYHFLHSTTDCTIIKEKIHYDFCCLWKCSLGILPMFITFFKIKQIIFLWGFEKKTLY